MKKMIAILLISVFIAGVMFASDNDAVLTQTGANNTVELSEIYYGNEAVLNQDGNGNSLISTLGDANTLNTVQRGDDNNITANLMNGNLANLNQLPDSGYGASGNRMAVNQNSYNTITVTQRGTENKTVTDQDEYNTAVIIQAGYDNSVSVNQATMGALVNADQYGDYNSIVTNQYYTSAGSIDIQQGGVYNEIDVYQIDGDNFAVVSQDFEYNLTDIDQYNSGNAVDTYQSGGINRITVKQDANNR